MAKYSKRLVLKTKNGVNLMEKNTSNLGQSLLNGTRNDEFRPAYFNHDGE